MSTFQPSLVRTSLSARRNSERGINLQTNDTQNKANSVTLFGDLLQIRHVDDKQTVQPMTLWIPLRKRRISKKFAFF
jgi:hypothetical protein